MAYLPTVHAFITHAKLVNTLLLHSTYRNQSCNQTALHYICLPMQPIRGQGGPALPVSLANNQGNESHTLSLLTANGGVGERPGERAAKSAREKGKPNVQKSREREGGYSNFTSYMEPLRNQTSIPSETLILRANEQIHSSNHRGNTLSSRTANPFYYFCFSPLAPCHHHSPTAAGASLGQLQLTLDHCNFSLIHTSALTFIVFFKVK